MKPDEDTYYLYLVRRYVISVTTLLFIKRNIVGTLLVNIRVFSYFLFIFNPFKENQTKLLR